MLMIMILPDVVCKKHNSTFVWLDRITLIWLSTPSGLIWLANAMVIYAMVCPRFSKVSKEQVAPNAADSCPLFSRRNGPSCVCWLPDWTPNQNPSEELLSSQWQKMGAICLLLFFGILWWGGNSWEIWETAHSMGFFFSSRWLLEYKTEL